MLKINGQFSDSAHVCTNYQNPKPVFQGFGAHSDQSGGKSRRRIKTVTAELQNPDLILISRLAIFPHL